METDSCATRMIRLDLFVGPVDCSIFVTNRTCCQSPPDVKITIQQGTSKMAWEVLGPIVACLFPGPTVAFSRSSAPILKTSFNPSPIVIFLLRASHVVQLCSLIPPYVLPGISSSGVRYVSGTTESHTRPNSKCPDSRPVTSHICCDLSFAASALAPPGGP